MSAKDAFEFLNSIRVEHAPESELEDYCRRDWRRFLYTWGLVKDLTGKCLELGANPFFTTGLLREFTQLKLNLANYFGSQDNCQAAQRVRMVPNGAAEPLEVMMEFHQFNVEGDRFPFDDNSFEVVLFCEIIEHLQNDPLKVLREIKRVLKPNGRLVLTTPNIARLENAARLVIGKNVCDRYSGYGPYGRHNREYTRQEIGSLLKWSGFVPEVSFTADVHFNSTPALIATMGLRLLFKMLWQSRATDLGQYIFVCARNSEAMQPSQPEWLYRSYPSEEIEKV
jgi:SAM-dependent methyltransferase